MPTNILLAPVGAGKTEIALDRLTRIIRDRPLARAWVLLATRRQEDAFRQRLTNWDDSRRVYFNVEFFSFYELYDQLLDIAGVPPRHLGDTAHMGLLRSILVDLYNQGELAVFSRIAHTPGFVRIVAEFIYELKQNRVYPNDFARAARHEKDHELARVYSAYQDRLIAENLVDREGVGWLALDVLEGRMSSPMSQQFDLVARDVDLLLVDGYDQFTVVQADLLTLLADRVQDTFITLTTVPEREATVGRRFKNALDRFLDRHERVGQSVVIADSPVKITDDRHADLQHLTDAIFRLDRLPLPTCEAINLIEAPDPAQEVAALLRQVKRRLLIDKTQPDDILIALRDWARYQPHFISLADSYHLPLALHYGEPLAQNPAIIALLDLLDLPGSDFRRRKLLDVLYSPYFDVPGLDDAAVDLLDRISRLYLVIGRRENWIESINQSIWDSLDEDEDEDSPGISGLNEDDAVTLADCLAAFFDGITPEPEATISDYVLWLETLIGPDHARDPDEDTDESLIDSPDGYRLRMLWRLRQPAARLDGGADGQNGTDAVVCRDLAAMQEFKRILGSLLSAQELLASIGESRRVAWSVFLADLKAAVNRSAVNPRPNRTGRVLVTTAANARGLPHDHVFIAGLSEGVFPAAVPEDPLYLDTERLALRAAGMFLETQAERAADDGLFYELISLPRKSLTLSRPTVEDGKLWIESHLWRAVIRVFAEIPLQKIGIGAVPAAAEVASLDDALLAAADGLNVSSTGGTVPVAPLYNWLREDSRWRHVWSGRAVELERLSRKPHNHYSGRLRSESLVAQVAQVLGQERTWSASQFNEYGQCGYLFFARRLLEMEPLKDPEAGMDARQFGTLNHEVLEQTYRRLADLGAAIAPDFVEQAVEILHEVADDLLENAPERLGFRRTALWEQEKDVLLRKLEALLRLDFSADSPVASKFGMAVRQPYRFEAPFGIKDAPSVRIDLGAEMEPVRVCGYIDRIDRQDDAVVVIDYKSSSTKIPVEEMEQGRNFQMMVYLLAAEVLLNHEKAPGNPHRVAGGLFWHLSNQKVSGAVRPDDEAIDLAREHLARYIALARRGDFAVHPARLEGGHCTYHCDFRQLCRVGSTNSHKRLE